jgi:hypothetical protein
MQSKDRGNDSEATSLGKYKILVKGKGTPNNGKPTKTGFTIAVAG